MGMAASQVRFLTLQDRKSTIGMRLGILSNRKMALTRDMNKAAEAYNEAYADKKLQWYDSINGKYTDITYNAMMSPNAGNSYTPYVLTDRNTGRVILDGQTKVGDLCGCPTSGTDMFHGMNKILIACGYHTPSTYKAGLLSYDETKMAPIIIKDIMGITSFDKDKMIYEGVKNKNISEGGWHKLVFSDVMEKMKTEITTGVLSETTSLAPLWEFQNRYPGSDSKRYTYSRLLNIATGEEFGVAYDGDGALISGNDGLALANALYYSHAYIDSSGNGHSLTEKTYWKTLYETGAVFVLQPHTFTPRSTDEDGNDPIYSIAIASDVDLDEGLYTCAREFVKAVNDTHMLRYDMSDAIQANIAYATVSAMKDPLVWEYWQHNGHGGLCNVDTVIDGQIEDYNFDSKEVTGTQDDRLKYNKFREIADRLTLSVYSDLDGDPIGTKDSGTQSLTVALAKQANATSSRILYQAGQFHVNNNKIVNTKWVGHDWISAFSVKNMMDIAMYFIRNVQERLAQEEETGNVGITEYAATQDLNEDTGSPGWLKGILIGDYNEAYDKGHANTWDTDFFYGNNRSYTDPTNYNQGEMEVWEQGETKVVSVYSMLSNLEMLKDKVDHCISLGYDVNDITYMYQVLKESLSSQLHTNITNPNTLVGYANINAWICEALEQDYTLSTDGINSSLDNAWSALSLLWANGFLEDKWSDASNGTFTHTLLTQNPAGEWVQAFDEQGRPAADGNVCYYDNSGNLIAIDRSNGFYYDKGTAWNRRSQTFSQDSVNKTATKRLDIEGQLNALQLHQFKFYVNLVKECLARGWSNHNTSTTSLDDNSVSLHLQNGTWLINDNMAKSSSRVFEVANKEAREEALSKYEALQSELKVKEERIDIQMDKLETEQNAIKTELDSLKNIIKENIDSTFKIFNA